MHANLKCAYASVALAALAAGAALGAGEAAAQADYPNRVIRIVTVNPAGSPPDIVARLIGERLTAAWGQPVVTESKVGAGGSLAAGFVAKAAPDGYTLLLSGDAAMVTNLHLYKSLTYDPQKDLAPISQVAFTPNILAVANDVPVKSIQDLVRLLKSGSHKLNIAHGGTGFSQHLAAEVFKSMGHFKLDVVAYRGGVTAVMPDLIAGRVSMCFCNISTVLPLMRDGKLKGLAVTSLKRSPFAPDLPTMAESGFPGFDVNAWFGLLAPAGTPAPIVAKLHGETARALAAADVRDRFNKLGMEVIGNSPAEFAAVIRSQIPQRKKTIEGAGIERQ
ncbi:MAG: tripartite tricarboxylate transporter substrate binding protein [Alphaproteobacteria bacterium]|nr:tripartite tricarboxylate transporter substrate binding protein [Alphaproteobacteria bacterium]